MAGYKETPRQKMIGMMYLFYTALLALNVSVEILNAFVIVNDGMEETVSNFGEKNGMLYSDFEQQMALNEAKTKPFYDKAMEVKKITTELVDQIETVKDKVVGYSEFGDENATKVKYDGKDLEGNTVEIEVDRPSLVPLEYIGNKSDYNKPMYILCGIGSEKNTNGEATKLKEAFARYKTKVLDILGEDSSKVTLGLNTEDRYNKMAGQKQNWETNTFYSTILAADLVLLNKYITEVRNIEFDVIKILRSKISADDFKFDKISAKVIPHANIVLSGDEYVADIFVAAYSTTESPTAFLKTNVDSVPDNNKLESDAGAIELDSANQGVVQYKVKTGSTGDFKYAGVIKVMDPNGIPKYYNFHSAYSVIKPAATISADKMNVVYRGLDNPISISAAGFTNEALTLTVNGGGSISKKSAGHYEFKPSTTGREKTITFRVTGKDANGQSQSLGSQEYRVLPLPTPILSIAGVSDGKISKARLLTSPYVTADLIGFLFDGVKYRVVSYELYFIHSRGSYATKVNGPQFSGEAIQKLRQFPVKTIVRIDNVIVSGPDGSKRAIGIALELN